MSHSKTNKRGRSLYVESWNPAAKNYIHTCVLCGHKGYNPSIEEEGFCDDYVRRAIYRELTKTLPPLHLDEWGRCEACARLIDEKNE